MSMDDRAEATEKKRFELVAMVKGIVDDGEAARARERRSHIEALPRR